MIVGIILNIILNGVNRQKDSRYHDFWGEYPDSFHLINSYAAFPSVKALLRFC
jgi:hypothetical protein